MRVLCERLILVLLCKYENIPTKSFLICGTQAAMKWPQNVLAWEAHCGECMVNHAVFVCCNISVVV